MKIKFDFDAKKLEKELNKQIKKIVENEQYKINLQNKEEGTIMVLLQPMEEEALKILLEHYDGNKDNCVNGDYEWFPTYIQMSINDVIDKMKMAGVIAKEMMFLGGFGVYLTPNGITYFEDKEEYLKQKAEEEKKSNSQNIININAERSNVVVVDVTNSTLSIDNSIHEIEKMIDEKGGEDKEQLTALLDEAKELLENINESRMIPKNKGFVKRLSDHMSKHGWFYGAVVQLLGTGALTLLGK